MKPLVFAIVSLAAAQASAEVASLRGPSVGRSVNVELGYPATSVSVWFNDSIGVGVSARVPLSSAGVQLGLRRTFLGDPREGWGLFGLAAFGIEITTSTPALLASATGSLGVRYFGSWFIGQLNLSSPILIRLTDDIQAKLPVLLELWLGGKAGGLWAAVHGSAGASFIVGYQPSPAIQLGVVLGLEF